MANRLLVWLTVRPDQEHAFNRWYQEEYIPRFVRQIPGIRTVSRWRIPDTTTYLTVYDLDPNLTQEALMEALRDARRGADREAWHQWETAALTDFRDGFFEQVFTYSAAAQ